MRTPHPYATAYRRQMAEGRQWTDPVRAQVLENGRKLLALEQRLEKLRELLKMID